MYLSIDPGDKRTGWASFDDEGILTGKGILHGDDEFYDFFTLFDVGVALLVCEQFELRKDKAIQQSGSKMVASKRIGYIEGWCRTKNIKLVMSRAQNLDIGLMYMGMKRPKGHCPDDLSAVAHGVFVLQQKGLRKPHGG